MMVNQKMSFISADRSFMDSVMNEEVKRDSFRICIRKAFKKGGWVVLGALSTLFEIY